MIENNYIMPYYLTFLSILTFAIFIRHVMYTSASTTNYQEYLLVYKCF